jgi:hypothetical protein
LEDVVPHLKMTLLMTGSFCIAWSWDLVAFGASHAWAGDNPMRDEIGFGNQRSPKIIYVLLLQYLLVTGLVAWLSYSIQERFGSSASWCSAAILAVEFVPSPFFSGKLMAYLGQFTGLTSLEQVLYNLLATAFAAFLAHSVQGSYSYSLLQGLPIPIITTTESSITATLPTTTTTTLTAPPNQVKILPPQLERFPHILSETLGFGLGVAWNVFLVQLLAPQQMDYRHILGLFGYLLVVLMIAFRITAMTMVEQSSPPSSTPPSSMMQRMLSMLAFAANVVCAFTMVAFIHALLAPGWLGDVMCLGVLVLLATLMSALVASVDTAEAQQLRQRQAHQQLHQQPDTEDETPKVGFGTCFAMDALIFVPCLWCCCPWIPLVWILAGITPDVTVKDKWQKLIAFVLGLATSIQASGMLTTLTNTLAMTMHICGEKYCHYKWIFVALQVLMAVLVTALLLPALAMVTTSTTTPSSSSAQQSANMQQGTDVPGERRPLLGKVKKLVSKFSTTRSSSKQ